ncbi:hypothetical protein [Paraburkholderia ultramafica]|nr:hypothetical protein [Paraburkholderia ultramafica]
METVGEHDAAHCRAKSASIPTISFPLDEPRRRLAHRLAARRPDVAAAARGGTAHITMEAGMSRELKTERELLELVVKALDANPATAGWIPTGFHETVEDEDGCNWDITHLHRDRKDADVRDVASSAAAAIINELRGRYNLR